VVVVVTRFTVVFEVTVVVVVVIFTVVVVAPATVVVGPTTVVVVAPTPGVVRRAVRALVSMAREEERTLRLLFSRAEQLNPLNDPHFKGSLPQDFITGICVFSLFISRTVSNTASSFAPHIPLGRDICTVFDPRASATFAFAARHSIHYRLDLIQSS